MMIGERQMTTVAKMAAMVAEIERLVLAGEMDIPDAEVKSDFHKLARDVYRDFNLEVIWD